MTSRTYRSKARKSIKVKGFIDENGLLSVEIDRQDKSSLHALWLLGITERVEYMECLLLVNKIIIDFDPQLFELQDDK